MTGFLNFAALCLVFLVAVFVFSVAEKKTTKAGAVLGGLVLIVLLVNVLPNAREVEDKKAAARAAATEAYLSSIPRKSDQPRTVEGTLRNFRHKGDSLTLECAGETGRVSCRTKRYEP